MSYMDVKTAADRWELTERRITTLCRDGRIAGAKKEAGLWLIPDDAEKPKDGRRNKFSRAVKTTAKLPLPIGVSDFKELVSGYYYVDKTLMLKEFIDFKPKVSLFTRPRRFGKTLAMDMLKTFFEVSDTDTSKYFKNKKIWSCGEEYRREQGKYPVIFVTFKDIKFATWEQTYTAIREIIANEYLRHDVLLTSDKCNDFEKDYFRKVVDGTITEVSMARAFLELSHMLNKHYGRPAVIIIDEYDTPIQQGYTEGYYEQITGFMRNLLSGCFKDNKSLAFGFLTGILRVAKESIFSGLNNLTINSVLDNKYSEYFGFTANEVKEMAAYYSAPDKFDEVCEWYDGYRFGKTDIFNPWSVINYFSNDCEPRAFWLSTGSNDIIGEIIKEADNEIYERLSSLVNGGSFTTYIDTSVIYPQIKNNPSSIYSFLLMAGYLKVVKSSVSISGDFMCEVALPNKEISLVYRKEILQKLENLIPQATAIAVEEAIFSGNGEKLRDIISNFLIQSVSAFDAAGENFYHGFMLGVCALFGNSYVTSNRESGDGRYDIALSPKVNNLPGIIIELKTEKNCNENELQELAKTALKQINDKKYDTELKLKDAKTIYKYGVAFSGKHVAVEAE
mgnify:CR=1 FL=1